MILGLLPTVTDEESGKILIQRYIFIHLETYESKYELLIVLLNKLLKLVKEDIQEDNADSLMNHVNLYIKQ